MLRFVGALRVVSREECGLRPPRDVTPLRRPAPRSWIHHTVSEPSTPGHVPREPKLRERWFFKHMKAFWRQVQAFHMDDNGWDDTGYNFGIAPGLFGLRPRVFVGRGANVGAHTQGDNSNSIGIVIFGNFEHKVFGAPTRRKLRRLLDELVNVGWLEGPRSKHPTGGHQNARGAATRCPGKNVMAQMAQLRRRVK